jgi:transcriptional/translational regulatory protein YebC/TACO1
VVASRLGGPNPDFNPALRLAVQKAKEANMPKDRVENLVKKAGDRENAELEELIYEAIGPFGTMLMISVITDKKNRTVSELRKTLEDRGGKMADGGVGWNFRRAGFVDIEVSSETRSELKINSD